MQPGDRVWWRQFVHRASREVPGVYVRATLFRVCVRVTSETGETRDALVHPKHVRPREEEA